MELEAFSNLVMSWNALALEVPAKAFKAQALDALQPHIKFSTAWWGTGVRAQLHPKIVQSFLYGLPPDYVTVWQEIAEHDDYAQAVQAQPGVTFLFIEDHASEEPFLSFSQRFDIGSTLATAVGDDETGVGTFLSVYRTRRQAPFTEQDRDRMQCLVPHLMHAAQLSWRRELRDQLQHTLVAYVDASECLSDASLSFCQHLVTEWPEWQGGPLPAVLLDALRHNHTSWQGRSIHLDIEIGSKGRRRLELTPRLGSGLSARQERVAREYAAGASYKEIARKLGLSPATVRTYLRDCYLKLGVSNKVELGERMAPCTHSVPKCR
jgi:DNA-binding CsgD family transcriptional regulator